MDVGPGRDAALGDQGPADAQPADVGAEDAGPSVDAGPIIPDLLEIEPEEDSVPVGASMDLAVFRWQDGERMEITGDPNLVWRVLDPAVLEIVDGRALGKAEGTSRLFLELEQDGAVVGEGQTVLRVDGRLPTDILTNFPSLTTTSRMGLGWTVKANFSVRYAEADGGNPIYLKPPASGLSWNSASPQIASFDAPGELTAHAVGSTDLSVSFGGITRPMVTMTVMTPQPVHDVWLTTPDWVAATNDNTNFFRCSAQYRASLTYGADVSTRYGRIYRDLAHFSNADGLILREGDELCGQPGTGISFTDVVFSVVDGGQTHTETRSLAVFEPGWSQAIAVAPSMVNLAANQCVDLTATVTGPGGATVDVTDHSTWNLRYDDGSGIPTSFHIAPRLCADVETMYTLAITIWSGMTYQFEVSPWFADAPRDVFIDAFMTAP